MDHYSSNGDNFHKYEAAPWNHLLKNNLHLNKVLLELPCSTIAMITMGGTVSCLWFHNYAHLMALVLIRPLFKHKVHEIIQWWTWPLLNPFMSLFSCGHIEQISLCFDQEMGFIFLISICTVSFLNISILYPNYCRLRSQQASVPFLFSFPNLFYPKKPEHLFQDISPSVNVSKQPLPQGKWTCLNSFKHVSYSLEKQKQKLIFHTWDLLSQSYPTYVIPISYQAPLYSLYHGYLSSFTFLAMPWFFLYQISTCASTCTVHHRISLFCYLLQYLYSMMPH